MQDLTAHHVVANTQTSKIVVHVSDTHTFVAVSQPNTSSGWGLVASGAASEAAVRVHCCEFVARQMFSLDRYFTRQAAQSVRQMAGRRKPGAPRRERFVFVALVDRLCMLEPGARPPDAWDVVRQLSAAGVVHTDLNQAANWGRDAQGRLRVIDFDDAYSLGADHARALALNTENAQKRLPAGVD